MLQDFFLVAFLWGRLPNLGLDRAECHSWSLLHSTPLRGQTSSMQPALSLCNHLVLPELPQVETGYNKELQVLLCTGTIAINSYQWMLG